MAIIGAILGDIAGSKWEFNRPKDLDYEHIELFQDDSYYTDDTVLSVATKYALENEVSFKDAYNDSAMITLIVDMVTDSLNG